MTSGQYRALVAYLNFWTPDYPNMNLETAMADIGITDDREDVVDHLWKSGWVFSEKTGQLTYDDELNGDDNDV